MVNLFNIRNKFADIYFLLAHFWAKKLNFLAGIWRQHKTYQFYILIFFNNLERTNLHQQVKSAPHMSTAYLDGTKMNHFADFG